CFTDDTPQCGSPGTPVAHEETRIHGITSPRSRRPYGGGRENPSMRASLVGVLIAALAACSSSPTDPGGGNPGGGNPGGGNPGGGNTVTLSGASFTPSTLTVATGTT